ncbi:MAG: SdpI family protein [bacterium]
MHSLERWYPIALALLRIARLSPWTLSNDRVWARTHRLAGYTMTAAGVAIIVTAALLSAPAIRRVILTAIVVALGAPVVYTYITWKQEMKQ